jgi:hypothetical protein
VRITDERLANAFPGYLFYISRYPQFPVARMIPLPLSANNLFAVKKELGAIAGQMPPPRQIMLITDPEKLKAFFLATAEPIIKPNIRMTPDGIHMRMKDMAYAWLRLSTELHNDGYYQFVIPLELLLIYRLNGNDANDRVVSGLAEVVPLGGNSGSISAVLMFGGANYTLTEIQETVKLQPGIRPVCQATKLLDPDPIVRKMAEQDLLVMGTAAFGYMMERRAEANPELQLAIDQLWQRIVERQRQ